MHSATSTSARRKRNGSQPRSLLRKSRTARQSLRKYRGGSGDRTLARSRLLPQVAVLPVVAPAGTAGSEGSSVRVGASAYCPNEVSHASPPLTIVRHRSI